MIRISCTYDHCIILYRYKCICVIIITHFYWCGQCARYKSVPDRNPSVKKSYSNSLIYVLIAVDARLELKISVSKYHGFLGVLNILDMTRFLPPQTLIQLDSLHFTGNSHKIASVPINVFNLYYTVVLK